MALESLAVQYVRIIEQAELVPSPGLNLITGPNAAGKTSLLEAIDLLSRGRSFRTRLLGSLLSQGQERLIVRARLRTADQPPIVIGIERSREATRMRVGGDNVASVSQLAALLPVQVLHPESHQLIEGGPAERRAFLDWGVFHVEPSFYRLWREYQRGLRQRNLLLRQKRPGAEDWEAALSATAAKIDRQRQQYWQALEPRVAASAARLLSGWSLELDYRRGWPQERSLAEAMRLNRQRDRYMGFTGHGPQRAELRIRLDGRSAAEVASRGQQKLIAAALKLAQVDLLVQETDKPCLFLADDLPAELDAAHRRALLEALSAQGVQTYVTAVDPHTVELDAWPEHKRFHVKQGRVEELV